MKLLNINQYNSEETFAINQSSKYKKDDYWEWSVWIEASESGLDKIDFVIYNLHYTFPDPVRKITTRENKFKLTTAGWGTFTIYAQINFKDSTVLELEHDLELYYPEDE